MLNGVADVDVSVINEWKSKLAAYDKGVSALREISIIERRKYYEEFERMRNILRERLSEAEQELQEAEERLYNKEQEFNDAEDDDPAFPTLEYSVAIERVNVNICRKKRDDCASKLTRCDLIIGSCRVRDYQDLFQNVEGVVKDAESYLNERIGLISAYNHVQSYDYMRAGSVLNESGEVSIEKAVRKGFDFQFFDDDGQPLSSSTIIVVDNKPMGFSQVRLTTDKDGKVGFECKDTPDCSIYLNGKEIYNGPLSMNRGFCINTNRIRTLNQDDDKPNADGQGK